MAAVAEAVRTGFVVLAALGSAAARSALISGSSDRPRSVPPRVLSRGDRMESGVRRTILLALFLVVGASPALAQEFVSPSPLVGSAATDTTYDSGLSLATDGDGTWIAAWYSFEDFFGAHDLYFARSTDRGITWSAPSQLNVNATPGSGSDRGSPTIAADRTGTWMAAWTSEDSLNGTIGTDSDVLVARSTDAGLTWSAPVPLNSNAAVDAADDSGPVLSAAADGSWIAVWPSSEPGWPGEILFARSTDGGMTWSSPVSLSNDLQHADQFARVAADGAGNLVAVWHRFDGGPCYPPNWGNRFVRSSDGGVTWSAPSTMGLEITDCLPAIASDGAGKFISAWAVEEWPDGGESWPIVFVSSVDGGSSWSAPSLLSGNASGSSGPPALASDGAGNWLAAWRSHDSLGGTIGADSDILVARSEDGGVTWDAPFPLNANASTDSGSDDAPVLATDGGGSWVAAWVSEDSLGGTIGTDKDLLVASYSMGLDHPVRNDQGEFHATPEDDGDGYYDCQGFLATTTCVDPGPVAATHLGEDWNREDGADCASDNVGVYAAADGTVWDAWDAGGGWGNVILVRHDLPGGYEVETMYGHVDQMLVAPGESVSRNEQIATFGNGGGVTACHLHFEVRVCDSFAWGQAGPGYSATGTEGWRDPSDFIATYSPAATLDVSWVPQCQEAAVGPGQRASLLGGSEVEGGVVVDFDADESGQLAAQYVAGTAEEIKEQAGVEAASLAFLVPDSIQLWKVSHGGAFSGLATLTLSYANSTPQGAEALAASSMDGGSAPVVYQLVEGSWVELDATVDEEAGTITVMVGELTFFAVGTRNTAVPALSPFGTLVGGSLVLVATVVAAGWRRPRHVPDRIDGNVSGRVGGR